MLYSSTLTNIPSQSEDFKIKLCDLFAKMNKILNATEFNCHWLYFYVLLINLVLY